MNHDCTTHRILPFITITTKFLSKHCIERVLDKEMNGYHCFNFTEPRGGASFSGEVQKFSEEVQNDLRGGAHLPHLPSKSDHTKIHP
jgi:hypothetical protein